MIRKKTPDQIMKANLKRVMGKVKTVVAKREQLWIDLFKYTLMLSREDGKEFDSRHVQKAARLANEAVDCFEERWGKGGD